MFKFKFTPVVFAGILAILAPIGYLGGRFSSPISADSYASWITADFISACLGVMIGIPIGLFFGSLRTLQVPATPQTTPNTQAMESDILAELKAELAENKALFEARKGSATVVARLEYVTTFWDAAKASGRLFVMQDAHLMSVIGLAYYWLAQANHLEKLAYDAKNSGLAADSQFTTAKLISEVRLLDGSIESALNTAIDAISTAR